MSSVQVVLKVDEKVFTLKFAYALDEELCASFPVNSKSWNDAIALIQGPYMAQVEGTETTFIPDLSMVPRIKIKKIFIFTKYEFILTQFGVDIYNFHEGTLTLRIKTIKDIYFVDPFRANVAQLDFEKKKDLQLDIISEIRNRNDEFVKVAHSKLSLNSWKKALLEQYPEADFYFFDGREFFRAKIDSKDIFIDYFDVMKADGSVFRQDVTTSMNFRIFWTQPSPVSGLDEAFECKLTKVGTNQRTFLLQLIDESYRFFTALPIYAPYTSLIQSSGYGKSKLTDEILTARPGISLVFRSEKDKGYPVQPKWIEDFEKFVFSAGIDELPIATETWNEAKATDYSSGRVLLALFTLIDGYYKWFWSIYESGKDRNVAIQKIGKHFLSGSRTWGDDGVNLTFPSDSELSIAETINLISKLTAKKFDDLEDEMFERKYGYPKRIIELILPERSNFPFLFFFDEVSNFDSKTPLGRLSGIHVLRRAFHALKVDSKLLIVAIGTASDAWDFSPAVRDNSVRYPERTNLLPPIWLTCNWDILFHELNLYNLSVDADLLLNRNIMKLLLTFGRPLWCSLLIESALSVAMTKLKNGKAESMEALMSYLLCRSDMNINGSSVLARTLVRSHMATVSFIDSDARNMKISYPSEPILALASSLILEDKNYRKMAFTALSHYLQRQVLDRGRVVETIHEHMILFAIDDATGSGIELTIDNGKFSGNVRKVLDCKKLILGLDLVSEESRPGESSSAASSQTSEPEQVQESEIATSEFYHIIRVSDFFKSCLREGSYNLVENLMPNCPHLMNAYMNANHFVHLQNDSSGILRNFFHQTESLRFQITRSILKYGLLRRCAFVMPPNQMGFDGFIPILLVGTEPNQRPIYSYIAIQSKSSMGYYSEEVARTEMSFHVSRCSRSGGCTATACQLGSDCISEDEFQLMSKEQLAIFMCFDSKNQFTYKRDVFGVSTKVLQGRKRKHDDVESVGTDLEELNLTEPEKDRIRLEMKQKSLDFATTIWPAERLNGFSAVNVVDHPGFGELSDRKKPDSTLKWSFGPQKSILNETYYPKFSLMKMAWKDPVEKFLTCLMINDIGNFENLLDEATIGLLKGIVNQELSPFNDIPDLHKELVIDSAINGSVSGFHQFDPYLRASRSMTPLPSALENMSSFNLNNLSKSFKRCFDRNSGDGEPLN